MAATTSANFLSVFDWISLFHKPPTKKQTKNNNVHCFSIEVVHRINYWTKEASDGLQLRNGTSVICPFKQAARIGFVPRTPLSRKVSATSLHALNNLKLV